MRGGRVIRCFVLLLSIAHAAVVAVVAAAAVPLLEQHSLEHFSKPGPYYMGTMMIDAPKTSIFRQSYGYAPVAVYFPTNEPGEYPFVPSSSLFQMQRA